jgi:hypothetical protein
MKQRDSDYEMLEGLRKKEREHARENEALRSYNLALVAELASFKA